MGRLSNNQKAFNTVWQHFVVKRSKQSIIEQEYTGDRHWAYRGPYRRRDAIGLLISDKDYKEKMESLTIEEVVEAYPDIRLPTKDMALLMRLQWAHDCVAVSDKEFTEKVRARLEQVAQDFKLQIPK
jgi:hypothetical protein